MREMFISQIKLRAKESLFVAGIILGFGMFGTVLFEVIMRVTGDEESTFEMATIMVIAGFIVAMFTMGMVGMEQEFHLAISMGKTRKAFTAAYMLVTLLIDLLALLVGFLVYLTEQWRLHNWWSGIPCETELGMTFKPQYLLPIIVVAVVFQTFFGVMFITFGRKAFWTLWALWMIYWLGAPKFSELAENPNGSIISRMAAVVIRFFDQISMITLIMGGCAVVVMMLIGIVLGMRKQSIKY